MHQSENINDLAKALAAAQSSLSAAKKDAINPHFKSQYATLQSVWEAAKEVLAPNGLSVAQTFEATDGRLMNIRTTLLHTSGQWITGVLSMAPQQATPQGIGSAITYGRRYALAAIMGIVADEDDDGNNATEPGRAPAQFKAPTAPQALRAALSRKAEKVAHTEEGTVPTGWRTVVVPKFIKKYAGHPLGAMPERDLMWWSDNYTPKEYQGRISQTDIDFREALTEAAAFFKTASNITDDPGEEPPF